MGCNHSKAMEEEEMMTSHSHHASNFDLFKGLGEEKTETTIPTMTTNSDDNDKKGSNGK